VIVEEGAGMSAWYPDSAYIDAGATMGTREAVIARADIVVTVSQPRPDDISRLRPGQVVIGMLATAAGPDPAAHLKERGVTAISLDRLPRTISRAQSMDVLSSQAAVSGYKSVLVAANAFGRYFPMLITAAGTSRPASVLVLGAGVAGLSAIGTARRLGAVVTGYDVRPETKAEVESLGAKFLVVGAVGSAEGTDGYARALTDEEAKAQQAELQERVASFDIVITTAQVPGRRPPVLVTAGALEAMRPGSVVVDLAASLLGGNVEGSVPEQTHITDKGVTIVGVGDLAAAVPTAASDAFSQNMVAVCGLIVRDGELSIDLTDEVLTAIVVTSPESGKKDDLTDEPIAAL
jgi:NAD(P) transhydrogenase subunit alpha